MGNPASFVTAASTNDVNTFTAAQTVAIDDATTNAVTRGLTLSHTTSGTAAAGIGAGLLLRAESAGGTLRSAGAVDAIHTTATDAAEVSALILSSGIAGSVLEVARLAAVASAVNGVSITAAATAGVPVVASRGSDTNVALGLASKGSGRIIAVPGGSQPMMAWSAASGIHTYGDTQTGVSPTINRPSGVVRVASGGATLTVTNSMVTTSSLVFAQVRNTTTNSVSVRSVEPGNGSFVIRLTGDPGASNADVAFFIVQPDAG